MKFKISEIVFRGSAEYNLRKLIVSSWAQLLSHLELFRNVIVEFQTANFKSFEVLTHCWSSEYKRQQLYAQVEWLPLGSHYQTIHLCNAFVVNQH